MKSSSSLILPVTAVVFCLIMVFMAVIPVQSQDSKSEREQIRELAREIHETQRILRGHPGERDWSGIVGAGTMGEAEKQAMLYLMRVMGDSSNSDRRLEAAIAIAQYTQTERIFAATRAAEIKADQYQPFRRR